MTDEAKVFETEAAQTRDRIAATIGDLQARLSPRALVDKALGSLGAASGHAVASVRGTAARHPLAFGAAGLAVGAGLLATSRVARAKVEYGDNYAAYADYDDGYAANLADGDPPAGRARASLDAIQHQAHATVDDNPLAVLAVGIATGALLGAVVPVSAVETSVFKEVNMRLGAAADAALAAAKGELDPSKLSLTGGLTGIGDRLAQSLIVILGAAGAALTRSVRPGSTA